MKLTIVSLIMVFCAFTAFSQNFDDRLSTLYSPEELSQIAQTNPERINILNYALDNACSVVAMPKGKESKLNGEIQIENLSSVSLDAVALKIAETNQYFKITGTDKVLFVKSFFILENEMNATK